MTSKKPSPDALLVMITTLLLSPLVVLAACGLAVISGVEVEKMLIPTAVVAAAIPIYRTFNLNPLVLVVLIPGIMIAGIRGAAMQGEGVYLTVLGLFFFGGFAGIMSLLLHTMVQSVSHKRNKLFTAVIGVYLLGGAIVGSSMLIDQFRNDTSLRLSIVPFERLSLEDQMHHLLFEYEQWPDQEEWNKVFNDVAQTYASQHLSLQRVMYQMTIHRFGESGLKILLDSGADINGGSDRIHPPHAFLQSAMTSRKYDLAKYAIERGFDVTKTAYNKTALHIACESSAKEVVSFMHLFLTYDIDINNKRGRDGMTALDICASSKDAQLEMVEALLKSGAKLPHMSGSGYPDRYDRFEDMFRQYQYKNGWID